MISVSSLAWGGDDEQAGFQHLAALGVSGVELIPKRIDDSATSTDQAIEKYRTLLADNNLSGCAMQAIYYGSPGLQLLADQEAFDRLITRTQEIAKLADALGIPVGVFGAPGVRNNPNLSPQEAQGLGAERLSAIDAALKGFDFQLGLEPVPAYYGNNFLPTSTEIVEMVDDISAQNIGLHLDISCVTLGGGDIVADINKFSDRALHFHVSEPDLAGFEAVTMDHAAAGKALSESTYTGAIAIEMKTSSQWKEAITTAVGFTRTKYEQFW